MASIPGSKAEVYFGNVDNPLPDWRKTLPENDPGDVEGEDPSAEQLNMVSRVLGFNPYEEPDDEDYEEFAEEDWVQHRGKRGGTYWVHKSKQDMPENRVYGKNPGAGREKKKLEVPEQLPAKNKPGVVS